MDPLREGLGRVLIIAIILSGSVAGYLPHNASTTHSILAQANPQIYPRIQNITLANVNQSESKTVLVPIDNLGSPFNWTDMRLTYLNLVSGIKITTDPLLFVDGLVLANTDRYSLNIGVSVARNVSFGSYTIPFTLTAKSSFFSPVASTTINFNLVIIVLKSQPGPFPVLLLFPPFILIVGMTMIGIILIWSKDWNISGVKK